MTDDSRIIELFFERSEQAIKMLDEKYGRSCRRTARNILSSEEDAEECVSDAYLAVWNRIPPEKPRPLLTYLLKIVRNLSLKRYRSNTALKRSSGYDAALDELAECLPSAENVADEVEAKQLADVVNRFLKDLDREERVMFVRRYWFGDSIDTLAGLFGISRRAVSSRLYRTREKLKTQLAKEGEAL